MIPKPPPVIDHARLLHYAILDQSVGYSGHTSPFVDGKELGRVPCLAICSDPRFQKVFLFHCDDQWDVLGCAGYATVEVAKAGAEHIYPGVSSSWIDSHVTEQEAERFLDELWGDERCSICNKRGHQVEELHGQGSGWICDGCLARDTR
jgi:hypothetical protein